MGHGLTDHISIAWFKTAVVLPGYCCATQNHRFETQFIVCYIHSKLFDNRHCSIASNNHRIFIDESPISITLKRHCDVVLTL